MKKNECNFLHFESLMVNFFSPLFTVSCENEALAPQIDVCWTFYVFGRILTEYLCSVLDLSSRGPVEV